MNFLQFILEIWTD